MQTLLGVVGQIPTEVGKHLRRRHTPERFSVLAGVCRLDLAEQPLEDI